MEKREICYHNYYINQIKVVLKIDGEVYNFKGYRNEKDLICISNPKEFLEKSGYKVYNNSDNSNYEIEKNNIKIKISKVSCTEFKRTVPFLLNNIYLGEFCEKTGYKLQEISNREYEIISSIEKMRLSSKGRYLLKTYEGFEEIARNPGDGTITIGYGVVVINTQGKRTNVEKGFKFNNQEKTYKKGDKIGEEEADQLLIHVLKKFEDKVNNLMIKNNFKLSQNQFDAFLLHFYNLGENLESNSIKYIVKYGVPKNPSKTFSQYIETNKSNIGEFSIDIRTNINAKNHIGYFEGNILDGISNGKDAYLGLARRRVDELELFYYGNYNRQNREKESLQNLLACYNYYKKLK